MDSSQNVKILLVITFIDSFCCGVLAPVTSPHVMTLGGTHISIALMISGTFISQHLSKDFLGFFEHRKKCTLTLSLTLALLSYFVLVLTRYYWIVILCRLIYALSNRIVETAKGLISVTEPEDTHTGYHNLVDIMNVAGLVIGPVVGGVVYDYWHIAFTYDAMLISTLTFISILLVPYLDQDSTQEREEVTFKLLPYYTDQIKSLQRIDLKEYWDNVLLKTAYVASFTIFFTKYPLLLNYNYNIGSSLLGYTMAYQHMLIFSLSWVVPLIKQHASEDIQKRIFDPSLLVCAVTLVATYYAPTFDCYLIIFVPMIITHIIVDTFWEGTIEIKDSDGQYDADDIITNIVKIIMPIIFGVICQLFGSRAFKMLAILPPAACVYVLNRRFIKPRTGVEEIKED